MPPLWIRREESEYQKPTRPRLEFSRALRGGFDGLRQENLLEASTKHQPVLRRSIGFFGAVGLGLGSILGTGVFVSLALVTGVAGSWSPLAVALAGLLAACNGLSSAQLASAHPVSGGTYEYGHKYVHPLAGYLAGWMFLIAKSASAATAALGFAAYLIKGMGIESGWLYPVPLALAIVLVITALASGGLRRSNAVNSIIVSITLSALGAFVVACLYSLGQNGSNSVFSLTALREDGMRPRALFEATALAFVAYAGYGRIATMGEEVTQPRRTIPRAIVVTLLISMALYLAVVMVSIGVMGAQPFADAVKFGHAPLEQVAQSLSYQEIANFIAFGATIAMAGVLLNLVLGLSRVILAMARRGEMPLSLSVLTAAGESPKRAVFAVGALIAALVSLGDIAMTWSLSAFCVLIYYGTTNLAALRMSKEERLYPRWISWAGLFGCLSLVFFIEGQTAVMGGSMLIFGLMLREWLMQKHNEPE